MSKSKERVLNYVPINDTIGVPGAIGEDGKQEQGEWIKATDFTVEHLDRMVARAKNRKQDVHSFLVGSGLRHVDGTPTLFFDEPEKEDSELPEGTPDSSWKNAEIKSWLESKGVDVPANTNKEGLLALVETVE